MELPNGWAEATIPGLVGSGGVFTDGDWVESKDQDPNGDVRLIQLADVGDGWFKDRSERYMTTDKARVLDCTYLQDNDLLVSRMADPIGRACLFPGLGQSCVTVVDVCVVRPGPDGAAPEWLKNAVNSPQFRGAIEVAASGTTRKRISRGNLGALTLPVPPLNEQRRIVARLEELTTRTKAARAALEAIPPLLDRFRQSVLAAAFRGDLTADWRAKNPDVEPASELLKRIRVERRRRWEEAELQKMRAKGKVPGDDRWKARYVEPEGVDAEGLPELPEGWVWTTVEQAAFVNLGRQRSPRNHNGPHMRPYLRAANVTWTGIDISDVREMNFDPTEVTGYLLEPGDILLSEGSGSAREVGKPAVFRGEVSGCCFQNTLVRVRCPVLALVEWLHLHFLCDALSGRFASLSRGIGIHHIGREGVAQWPIAVPPLEEQRRILAVAGQTLGAADATQDEINAIMPRLDHLHQSLLAKAFRGELVPQDPDDEPASVLLERIRQKREAAGANGKSRRGRKVKQESSRAGVPILAEESPVRLAESEV